MKCRKLSLVLLSLLLVSSPAFCGWGFLNGSKTESVVLEQPVTVDTELTEPEQLPVEVKAVEADTTTLEDKKTQLLSDFKEKEKEIASLSQKLDELENSSMLLQSKKIAEFRKSLMTLNVNWAESNQTSKDAEELLNDYDAELAKVDNEVNKIHVGVGASYGFDNKVFSGDFSNQRVSLDTYVRKNNIYLNGSVDYPVEDFMNFNTDKLGYKVGIGYEF